MARFVIAGLLCLSGGTALGVNRPPTARRASALGGRGCSGGAGRAPARAAGAQQPASLGAQRAALRGGGDPESVGQKLVLIGAVGMLFCSVHRSIFSVGIVPIKEQLALSGSQVGVLQSAYLLGYMLTNQLGGVLVDKLGGAPVLLSCLALWSVVIGSMPLMTMTAAPVAALAAARFIFGVLTGPALPGAVAAVSQWLSPATRSQGLANVYVAFNLGTALGCFLGQLIPVIGWPALFYVFGALGVAWATGGLAVTKALTSATPQPAAPKPAADAGASGAGGGKLRATSSASS